MKIKLLLLSILTVASFILTYHITDSPPGLHGDELGFGYNAYSLLKTSKDEYGISFPLTFRNDYDPLTMYAYMLPVAIFGLNETIMRIYTALIGIFSLFFVYKLLIQLFNNQKISILSIFLIALSSWFIRINRFSVSITWALLFQLLGIYLFYLFLKSRKYLLFSFLFFCLSVITYQSTKMTTPLILLFFFYQYRQQLKKRYNLLISYFILFIVFPICLYLYVRPFSEMRFPGISAFATWKTMISPDISLYSFKSIVNLINMIITNYINSYNITTLFIDNSNLRYFHLNNLGLFYIWQIPFILLGFIKTIVNLNNKKYQLILYLILISAIPVSLTTGVPYANVFRNLLFMPFIEIICAIGIIDIFNKFKTNNLVKQILIMFIITCCGFSFNRFLYQYFVYNSHEQLLFWGRPFKEVMPLVLKYENSVNKIIMTNPFNQTYIYYLFYGNKDPKWLLEQSKIRSKIVGYSKINNYEFRPINWDKDKLLPNTLLIGTDNEIPSNADNIIYESINTYNQEILLRIVKN